MVVAYAQKYKHRPVVNATFCRTCASGSRSGTLTADYVYTYRGALGPRQLSTRRRATICRWRPVVVRGVMGLAGTPTVVGAAPAGP